MSRVVRSKRTSSTVITRAPIAAVGGGRRARIGDYRLCIADWGLRIGGRKDEAAEWRITKEAVPGLVKRTGGMKGRAPVPTRRENEVRQLRMSNSE